VGRQNTHFADEFAEKEVDQLAEKEYSKGKNEPPHGSELVKPANDNVCRDSKIQKERTGNIMRPSGIQLQRAKSEQNIHSRQNACENKERNTVKRVRWTRDTTKSVR
jgi:hypothetical protein